MRDNIVISVTEPSKHVLWMSPQGLKRFGKKGWELVERASTEAILEETKELYITPEDGILPEVGKPNKIYSIPSSTPTDNNKYEEFIYTNGKWEQVGDVSVGGDIELDDYAKKEDLPTSISNEWIDSLIKD